MVQLKLTLNVRTPETHQFYFQPVELDNIAIQMPGVPFPFRQSDQEASVWFDKPDAHAEAVMLKRKWGRITWVTSLQASGFRLC